MSQTMRAVICDGFNGPRALRLRCADGATVVEERLRHRVLAEERAPNGFNHIHDVVSQDELDAIANKYKQMAGFDQATVKRLAEQRAAREAAGK